VRVPEGRIVRKGVIGFRRVKGDELEPGLSDQIGKVAVGKKGDFERAPVKGFSQTQEGEDVTITPYGHDQDFHDAGFSLKSIYGWIS
jgi:hypothetical protein